VSKFGMKGPVKSTLKRNEKAFTGSLTLSRHCMQFMDDIYIYIYIYIYVAECT
jgi:hypothetical protein